MSEGIGRTARRAGSDCRRSKPEWLILIIAVWLTGVFHAQADSPALNFFTNTADRLIRYTTAQWCAQDPVDYSNTFGGLTNSFSLTNIPVRINGQFVYTPAVNRLLQLSANLYEATTNTFYPAVYRPGFYVDPSGNIFISGYNQILPPVTPGTAPLDLPISISALPFGYSGAAPDIANRNVYGIPWIIGARKYLPNFNQLYMQNVVQITRKIEVNRAKVEGYHNGTTSADFTTNQLFIMSITNHIGCSFWNSYQTNYPGGLPTVYARDLCWMTLTNNMGSVFLSPVTNVFYYTNLATPWPGANWNANYPPVYRIAATNSFFFSEGDFDLLPPEIYSLGSHMFSSLPNGGQAFNTNDTSIQTLDQFGQVTSNWFQAYIVDNGNVIDYVEFNGPNSAQNLNNEMFDSLVGANGTPYYDCWITNANVIGVNYGLANQIYVSQQGRGYAPNTWRLSGLVPSGMPDTVANEAAYFDAFFAGAPIDINGQIFNNTNLSQQAPYVPTRTMANTTVWQANDPLVHYLTTDLNDVNPFTGLFKTDDTTAHPVPAVLQNAIGQSTSTTIREDHYQPWGVNSHLEFLTSVDTNAFNSAYRDPLVYSSDDWDFPTSFSPTPDWLGRIHRGTPWQTIYLKSTNILDYVNQFPPVSGFNTWMDWSGDTNTFDTVNCAPIADHALLTPLLELFNPNDIRTLISVNDPNMSDWLMTLDGLDVLTNSTLNPFWNPSQLTFDDLILSSNSPAALILFNAIQAARNSQPNGYFKTIGDLLNTPALAEQSPFLDTTDSGETSYGISDEAYERIAAQLLYRVRADSIGSAALGGQTTIQFSGTDGYAYAIQVSPDLVSWTTASTNFPVNDVIQLTIPTGTGRQFYRSVLLPP